MNRSDLSLYSALVAEPQNNGRSSGPCDVIVLATEPHKYLTRSTGRYGARTSVIVPASTRSAKGVFVARKTWDGRWVPQVISLEDLFTPEQHAALVARREQNRQETADRAARAERDLLRKVEVVDLLTAALGSTEQSRARRAHRFDTGGPSLSLDVLENLLNLVAEERPVELDHAILALAAERDAAAARDAAWRARIEADRAVSVKVDEAVASIGR